ncbi:MAG: twin-arginine translocase subunit TatC [Opitutales bacterium]
MTQLPPTEPADKAPLAEQTSPPAPNRAAGEMSLLDHLEELRGVLIRSLAVLVVGCCIAGALFTEISQALQYPLKVALDTDDPEVVKGFLRTFSPYAVFSLFLQIIVYGGAALASPFILYFIGTFLVPALNPNEKRILLPGILAGTLLFIAGAAFAFFVVQPLALEVSFKFNELAGTSENWGALDYYGGVILLTLGMGAGFEFPLLLVILQYLGVLTPDQLKRGWRWALLVILIFSAILTPADILSMVIAAIPLSLLYVGSIVVGSWVVKAKAKRDAAYWADEDEAR